MKRSLEEENDVLGEKRSRGDGKLDTRWIIRGNQAGGIIGKGGSTIQSIRQDSGACVSILNKNSKADKQSDQVMLVRGSIQEVAAGLQLIGDAMLQSSRQENAETAAIQMLVPSCQVGAIIGKAGVTIQAIQTDTTASIKITKEALGVSTDKGVDMIGTPAALRAATERILIELEQHPVKEGTPLTQYKPGAAYAMQPQYPVQQGYPMFDQYQTPFMQQPYGAVGGAAMRKPANAAGVIGQSMGGVQDVKMEQKISIPAVCSGSVIGKRGATIQAMCKSSGANIIIAPPDETSPSERIVSIKGSPEGIERAINMIRQVIEQFQYNPQSQTYAAASY